MTFYTLRPFSNSLLSGFPAQSHQITYTGKWMVVVKVHEKKNPAFPVINGLSNAVNRPNLFVCINHNIPTSVFWPRTGLIGCHSQELMWFVMLLIFPSGLF